MANRVPSGVKAAMLPADRRCENVMLVRIRSEAKSTTWTTPRFTKVASSLPSGDKGSLLSGDKARRLTPGLHGRFFHDSARVYVP